MPTNVNISLVQPVATALQLFSNISLKAGNRAVFSCRSPDSFPMAEISWQKNNFAAIAADQTNLTVINSTSMFTTSNEYDTISYMAFDVSSADHLKEVRCSVRVGNIQRTMHGSIILDVKCKY